MSIPLITSPWGPAAADGRRGVILTPGKKLAKGTVQPLIWSYDDGGEPEEDAVLRCGPQIHMLRYLHEYDAKRINTTNEYCLYVGPQFYDDALLPRGRPTTRNLQVRINDPSVQKTRDMTFWIFGQKIQITVSSDSMKSLASIAYDSVPGVPNTMSVTVNDTYCGIWPSSV